jgi:short-subunit dehydrogenase
MGKVVVITGASSGIGAALARLLGSQGHSLALAARREAELRQVAEASSTTAVPVVADLTRRPDVERLRDAALKAFGHVDVWVNNAGRGISRGVLELTDADVDEMIAVNLKAALWGMQAIVPHFKERGAGHLVNVSSFLGRVPMVASRSAYNGAKSALNALTANLRQELRVTSPGVKVSLVMPGMVATNFARNALGASGQASSGGAGAAPTQTAVEVAQAIADLLESPVPELYTQPGQKDMARRFLEDPVAFEQR